MLSGPACLDVKLPHVDLPQVCILRARQTLAMCGVAPTFLVVVDMHEPPAGDAGGRLPWHVHCGRDHQHAPAH
jgi:hypothetical protein